MKKYGFILVGMILIVFFLTLTACQPPKPVQLVKSELNLMQEMDESTIQSFISYEDMMHTKSNLGDIGPEAAQAVQLFFKNFRYQILSYSITDQRAIVNVKLTNIDAKELAKELCLKLIGQSVAPGADAETLDSMDAYFSMLGDILSENDYELVTTTAHFELVKADDIWSIQSTETLEDELVGGFISYLHDPYLVTPEEILSVVFEMYRQQAPEDWVSYLGMNDIFSTYSSLYEKVDLALATKISKCFSYKIHEVTVEENSACATVEITSLNLDSVLDTYLDKLLDYAATTDAVRATDTELADKTAALLIECLNSSTDTYTESIQIPFTNNGVTWTMQLGEDFTNVLLGNMSHAVEIFQKNAFSDESVH